MVQLCGAGDRGADYSIGIVASSTKTLEFVQEAGKTWAQGKCVSQADASEGWLTVTLRVPAPVEELSLSLSKNSNGTGTGSSHQSTPRDIDVSAGFSWLRPGPTASSSPCKRARVALPWHNDAEYRRLNCKTSTAPTFAPRSSSSSVSAAAAASFPTPCLPETRTARARHARLCWVTTVAYWPTSV